MNIYEHTQRDSRIASIIGHTLVGAWAVLALAAVILLLTGCASSGFYQMSDDWCDAHPRASEARCIR